MRYCDVCDQPAKWRRPMLKPCNVATTDARCDEHKGPVLRFDYQGKQLEFVDENTHPWSEIVPAGVAIIKEPS